MKLATLKTSNPDGELVIVSRDLHTTVRVNDIAPTLQAALDDWMTIGPRLDERYQDLLEGKESKEEHFDPTKSHSPLPGAYQWLDGSVSVTHDVRMAK
jgi:fumarylacetoacetate (FAA) hydrolase